MSKNIFDIALDIFRSKGSFDENKGVSEHKRILKDEFKIFETALELGKLYKEALRLNIYINENIYEPEFNEDGERNHYVDEAIAKLEVLKNQIKELENNEN